MVAGAGSHPGIASLLLICLLALSAAAEDSNRSLAAPAAAEFFDRLLAASAAAKEAKAEKKNDYNCTLSIAAPAAMAAQ